MISAFLLVVGLVGSQSDLISEGSRALESGRPEEAAPKFEQALAACTRNNVSGETLLHLRITLASAYLEAGDYHAMEVVLNEAQKTVTPNTGFLARAELLNARSALHIKHGQLAAAEAELREAMRLSDSLASADDIHATVLHNLAAIEMHTGKFAESMAHERAALSVWQSTIPPSQPSLIRGWASLSSLEYMDGRPGDAAVSIQRAINSAMRIYGPTHPIVADLLDSDAVILDSLHCKKEARQARETARNVRGSAHRDLDGRHTVNLKEVSDSRVHPEIR